jgi:two-component system, cell cycle sensor histidine kinase and response regulator CckA
MTDNGMANIYRLLVEQSPVAIAVHEIIRDDQDTPADYRFLAANAAFAQHTGLDHESIIGQTVRQVLPGIDETDFVARYGKVVDTGYPDHFESYSKPLNRHYAVDAFKVAENVFATLFTDITSRKQAEAQRIAAENRNRALITASPDHFFVISKEGRFLDVQTSMPNLLLTNPETIPGKSIEDFLPLDITSAFYRAAEEALCSRNAQAFEYELELSSGRHTFEARVAPMSEGTLLCVVRDITREADLKSQLEASQNLYKQLVENQNDLVVKVDLEGRFEFVSPSYCRMFGKAKDELIGKCYMPLVHEDDRETTAREMEKLFVPPYSCQVAQRAMTADGWRWIMWSDKALLDDHNKVVGIVGVGRDITAEREAIMARNALAEQLSEAQQIAKLGSWDYIAATNTLTWSDQLYRIFGLDKSSFKNTYEHFLSFVHEDDRRRIMDEYERSLHDPNTLYNTEHRIVRAQDGEVRWVHEQCRHERDADGAVIRSIGIAQDITEVKNDELQKEELREQMLHAQKMESVGHLAGGVAHDFNNLLMVIMGWAEMILDSLRPEDPLREDVLQIVDAGKCATNLTRQLLAFSRKQTLVPVVLNINHIIANLEKMLGRLVGEHIIVKTALARDVGLIRIDAGQLEQIIMNLAVNARDAMPDGGTLVIETGHVHGNQPGVQLVVTDTGCGITKEVAAHIFDPFFTTKALGKGTGLGLSTVYGIVIQSQGDIQVFSELGKGTSFRIFFPYTEALMERSSIASAMTSCHNADKHILLVEDSDSLLKIINRQLTSLGYTVTVAANGSEAMRLVEDKGFRPDLIITDVIMPNMSGKELVELVRRNHPHLKAIYMSGYADEAIMPHGILNSDTPFIQKPFGIHDLDRKIQEVLGHALAATTRSVPEKERTGDE